MEWPAHLLLVRGGGVSQIIKYMKQIIAEAYLNSPLVNLSLDSCGFVFQIRIQLSNPCLKNTQP